MHMHRCRGLQWNEGEARVVMAHVARLVEAGVAPQDIGVIAPYSAQVGGAGAAGQQGGARAAGQ